MNAEIITIGDEILIGQIVDTNSAWMGQQLNPIGVDVTQITSISDQRQDIVRALQIASERVQLVLITGGLGPTKDDVTKQALCEFFHCGLRRDERVLAHVEGIFKRFNRPMLPINQQQADVLEICEVVFNEYGTAPGMWITQNQVHYMVMPGVPFEMKHLMQAFVLPHLEALVQEHTQQVLVHHTILTAGLGESYLAEQIAPIEEALPAHIRLAYLPQIGAVRLRLSGRGQDEIKLREEVEGFAQQIAARVEAHVVVHGSQTLVQALLERMQKAGKTLALAESCTGGYLAHQWTSLPGSSEVFLGSCVSYANSAKQNVLGVSAETLDSFGAVSEATVREMAEGARRVFGSDYAIATSGIAGPGGGTPEKPVGYVWIAVAGPGGCEARAYQFAKDRLINIERATQAALYALWTRLRKDLA